MARTVSTTIYGHTAEMTAFGFLERDGARLVERVEHVGVVNHGHDAPALSRASRMARARAPASWARRELFGISG